jgi:hypothetical protein
MYDKRACKKYYEKNKDRILERHRRHRLKYLDVFREKDRVRQGKRKDERREYNKRLWEKQRGDKKIQTKMKLYLKSYRDGRRKLLISLLGGKCVRCGFSDARALQIDHRNGGGSRESKSLRGAKISFQLKRVLAGDNNYQLLCANCNWIKRFENGETANAEYLLKLDSKV